jgi:hypothetical protein
MKLQGLCYVLGQARGPAPTRRRMVAEPQQRCIKIQGCRFSCMSRPNLGTNAPVASRSSCKCLLAREPSPTPVLEFSPPAPYRTRRVDDFSRSAPVKIGADTFA